MKISLVLLLSGLSLGNSEIIKRLVEKQNKACVGTVDKVIKLGWRSQTIENCKQKCKNDDKCVAMQYVAPKFCSLYYSPLEKMKKVEDANSYCGRIKIEGDTSSPTSSPTIPTPTKEYDLTTHVTCVKGNKEWQTHKQMNLGSMSECQSKCDAVPKCKSFQWNGKISSCLIFKYKIAELKEVSGEAGASRFCAILKKTKETTDAPTKAPTKSSTKSPIAAPTDIEPVVTPSPTKTPTKAPIAAPTDSQSDSSPDEPAVTPTKAPTKAPTKPPTKSPTNPPTKSPTKPPTNLPTKSPTKSPTGAPVAIPAVPATECELRAILKYPWGTNPDDAPYYGYVSEYLEVREAGDDWWVCSGYYRTDLPDWCAYSNTSPDPTAEGANLENYEDYYDPNAPDMQTSETVIISGAAARVFNFDVLHWFWANDYYADYETWNDHMIASVLKIKNLSNSNQNFLSDGWSHPVDINTKTHIQDANGSFSVNPAYKGDIRVVVWCDDNCFCNYSYEVL